MSGSYIVLNAIVGLLIIVIPYRTIFSNPYVYVNHVPPSSSRSRINKSDILVDCLNMVYSLQVTIAEISVGIATILEVEATQLL
jgi:hypothetical protein